MPLTPMAILLSKIIAAPDEVALSIMQAIFLAVIFVAAILVFVIFTSILTVSIAMHAVMAKDYTYVYEHINITAQLFNCKFSL